MKTDPFFRKQAELHDPCPVVPPREASIRSLAARAYHTQGRHMTLDPSKQQALTLGHGGLSSLTSSGASGTSGPASSGAAGSSSISSGTATLPQRTLTMPSTSSVSSAPSGAVAAGAGASASSTGGSGLTPGSSKVGGSRDSLLESSSSGLGRLQKQNAGAYSKSYTLV